MVNDKASDKSGGNYTEFNTKDISSDDFNFSESENLYALCYKGIFIKPSGYIFEAPGIQVQTRGRNIAIFETEPGAFKTETGKFSLFTWDQAWNNGIKYNGGGIPGGYTVTSPNYAKNKV